MQGLASRLVALAAAAALLAGCEASESTPESKARLKVAHASGETIVPSRADRVVTLASDALDASLALGVSPVGAGVPAGQRRLPAYLGRLTRGVRSVGSSADPDLGRIEALDPNLILANRRGQGRFYRRLAELAPTVTSAVMGRADWELNVRLYSEALNRPQAGERLLGDYDRRVAQLRRFAGPRRGQVKVSLVRTAPDGVRAYAAFSFAGSILKDAGIGRPQHQTAKRPYFVVASRDIDSLDGDLILLSRAPGSESVYRRLVGDPRWQALGGVRRGRVRRVDDSAFYVGNGMLAARAVMRDLRRLLPRG